MDYLDHSLMSERDDFKALLSRLTDVRLEPLSQAVFLDVCCQEGMTAQESAEAWNACRDRFFALLNLQRTGDEPV